MTIHNGSKGTRLTRLIEAAETVCTRRPNTILRVADHTKLAQSQSHGLAIQEGSGKKRGNGAPDKIRTCDPCLRRTRW